MEILQLRHIPIPGVAYLYSPSGTFKAVIGFPFTSVEYKPFKPLTLEASYFSVRTVRVRATDVIFAPLRVLLVTLGRGALHFVH